MKAKRRTILWSFLGGIALFVLVLITLIQLRIHAKAKLFSTPEENGYEVLVHAAHGLQGDFTPVSGDAREMEEDKLADLVTNNSAILEQARKGLAMECVVPVEFTEDYMLQKTRNSVALKSLSGAFWGTGVWHERQGRFDTAASHYLECMELGQSISRGGLAIDRLIGTACEMWGQSGLSNCVERLSLQASRTALQRLKEFDAIYEKPEEVMKRERAWSQAMFPWYRKLAYLVKNPDQRPLDDAGNSVRQRIKEANLARRQLMVRLAQYAYTLENPHPPSTLQDLVPDYLDAPPTHPETGKTMQFKDLNTTP